MEKNNGDQFSSRFAIVAASIGMAVGTGNIWRFPRIAGMWGGGTFLFALTVAVIVWAIPLLIGEFLIGYKTRVGNIAAFRDFMGKKYTWMGAWLAFCALGITFYYSVVAGWSLRYFVFSISGAISPGVEGAALWDTFISNPAQTIFFHFIATGLTVAIIYRGIKGGVEKVLKILLPSLFIILGILAVRALFLPDALVGLSYLFVPEWGALLSGRIWLEAFTQAAWSTGAGWGLLMVYAVYSRENDDIGRNSSIIAFADVLAGFLAGTAILITVFSMAPSLTEAEGILAAGNVGLTFIYIVELLVEMPGGFILSPLFFLALSAAAISSLTAMIELATTNLIDTGFNRKKAAVVAGIGIFILGVPSAIWIDFLDNQDWVWGVGLLISGLLVALALMKYGVEKARQEVNDLSDIHIGKWWSYCIRLFPVMFIFIFGWWIMQSIQWYPDDWWNPFIVFSTGTMVVQWLLLALVTFLANNYMADNLRPGKMSKLQQSEEG
ncbi:MAG: sodium-dependent transporter [Bacillota bacterium]